MAKERRSYSLRLGQGLDGPPAAAAAVATSAQCRVLGAWNGNGDGFTITVLLYDDKNGTGREVKWECIWE